MRRSVCNHHRFNDKRSSDCPMISVDTAVSAFALAAVVFLWLFVKVCG